MILISMYKINIVHYYRKN